MARVLVGFRLTENYRGRLTAELLLAPGEYAIDDDRLRGNGEAIVARVTEMGIGFAYYQNVDDTPEEPEQIDPPGEGGYEDDDEPEPDSEPVRNTPPPAPPLPKQNALQPAPKKPTPKPAPKPGKK